MANFDEHSLEKHMHVYSSDDKEVGRVEDIYEDSFKVHKGILPGNEHYYSYESIGSVENSRVQLLLTEEETKSIKWTIRPNSEAHESDPVQLMYDRGHGAEDPFDETNPTAQ